MLSLASLEPLQKDVGEARQALEDAERFAQALNEQINRSGMVSTEAKAYLIADEQAHGRIANVLATIETLLARVVRPE